MSNDRVQTLVGILAAHPEGLGPVELYAALRERWPHLTEAQARTIVEAAGERLEVGPDRIALRGPVTLPEVPEAREEVRVLAFDCETAVRLIANAPYTEAQIFQLAATRFGTDRAWVEEEADFDRFVELPEGFEIFDPQTRARHAEAAAPAVEVLADFARFAAEADYLVAYNGEVADFVFIDHAASAAHTERIEGPERVDALYLALCLHPHMSRSHRLFDLAAVLGIDTEGLVWHDALGDSVVLARLLEALAAELAALDAGLQEILAALGATSPAWGMLFALAGLDPPTPSPLDAARVGAVVAAALAPRPPLRSGGRAALGAVPDHVKSDAGVDPRLVAAAARGGADERPAQDEMARVLRRWIRDGTDGMCEAPTGIGKTYVTLSTALEWLEAHPTGSVVIATHTKQLQRQLASEIDRLAQGELSWLRAAAGLVKGARNRLSLRGLVRAAADTSAELAQPPAVPGPSVFGQRLFCELVGFLVLRLCLEPHQLADEWEARSVDPMDMPAFFESYTQGALGRWLVLLSQAETGDYGPPPSSPPASPAPGPSPGPTGGPPSPEVPPPPPSDPLSFHTDFVPEAVERHRLVVTNHALLLSHRDNVGDPETLLIVDEAHALESTVTDALTKSVDYLSFELIARETARCARELAPAIDVRGLDRVADDLVAALRSEILPNSIARSLDTILGPALRQSGNRAVTLASGWGGDQARGSVLRAIGEIRRLRRPIEHLGRVIGAITGSPAYGTLAAPEAERLEALWARASGTEEACRAICDVADAVFGAPGPPPGPAPAPAPAPPGPGVAVADPDGSIAGESDADDEDQDDETPEDDDPPDADDGSAAGALPPVAPGPAAIVNRIVWADEQDSPALIRGMRYFRFAVHASPVELAVEGEWTGLRARFGRSILISATLSVAPDPPRRSGFEFMRQRLGFGPDVAEHRLPASFDYANHARLFVMSDFPSWAEHEAQATRTASWQLAGFCSEVTAQGPVPQEPGAPRPLNGGAMVITTSTAAAATIADRLDADLATRGTHVPVHAAVLRGNQRALSEFKERGGVLVGTKGLWAGVDVEDPDRVRLLWINKLPFAPFADPLIQARIAAVAARAADAQEEDPDAAAQRDYYLPLAALELRQGIGRLIRSESHRGVIVISDRRLAGADRLRRLYREIFLGSLDPGLLVAQGPEPAGGNVVTMAEAWDGIWDYMARWGNLSPERSAELRTPQAIETHSVPPELAAIRALRLGVAEYAELVAVGEEELVGEVQRRCVEVARLLSGNEQLVLHHQQLEAIAAVVMGRDVLALLPTGFGKSYCYQLPALVLPGVTVVVSPLVALMADQAMTLNRTIGGAVRAIVAPLRDSSSRAGKAEVAAALRGEDNGIKLVYVSPERAAQRAFREALYEGAATGALGRVAIDEAHTLVQWGDDFRPSFRRLQPVLAELRTRAHASGRFLSIGAYTATANPSVRDELLRAVFGQAGGDDPVPDPPAPPPPVVVSASPIRPELAIYSRQLTRGGAVAISGLAEAVADAAPGHLIIYCLTVNEVQSTYAQLRAWIGPEREWQVRRFHGRLSGAEKSAVLDAFKHAPGPDDPGYYRMIVVATSAFGLGVDRADVSAVLCLSPPADLASLYQQLGRAGRALAQGGGVDGQDGAVGMALGHRAGWRMVEFLTTTDLALAVLCDLGRRVLDCGGLLDPRAVADDALAAAVAAGTMSPDVARLARTREDYRAGVVRAMAILGALGAVVDHGDVPAWVKVTTGPYEAEEDDERAFVTAVLDAVATLAAPDAQGVARVTCLLADLHAALVTAGEVQPSDTVAETWVRLYDAHGAGLLDVSQYAPDQRFLTALEINTLELPEEFAARIGRRRARALVEIQRLRDWFTEAETCAQGGFAAYFGEPLPPETCAYAACRCSRCWFDPAKAADPDPEPALYDAFMRYRPAPMAPAEDARRTARLERQIQEVLRLKYAGVSRSHLEALFTGSDTTWNGRMGRGFRVPGWILDHALFGSGRGWLKRARLTEVLDRLEAQGAIGLDGRRWRLAAYLPAQPPPQAPPPVLAPAPTT